MTALLEVRGLSKRYGPTVALDDVSVTAAAGEIVGLVGKNGAGKSTLIRVVSGAVAPDRGEVRWRGAPVHLRSPRQSAALGIAVLHQELNLAPNLTVGESIGLSNLPTAGRVVHRRALYRRAAALLAELGLADLDPARPTGELPLVEQRLVMVAAALWRRAELVILDEPTASLTDDEIEHLHGVIRSLAGGGVGVVYVSHRLDEIFDLTTRVVVMRDGRVARGDTPTAGLGRDELVGLIAGDAAGRRAVVEHTPAAPGGEALRVAGLTGGPVHDVSFSVGAGEVVGVAGLVGAGRTELLRLVYGADRASAGTVHVQGRPYERRSPRESLRRGLALLTEDRRRQGLLPNFGVRHNITIASLRSHRHHGRLPLPARHHESRTARAMIDRLAIVAASDAQPVTTLSGGNQQKTLLGRWLSTDCRVLLLDEPTVGIDVTGKADLYRAVRQIAAEGVAVVVVSSDFAELVDVCDRVLVMRDGRLVAHLDGAFDEQTMLEHCYAST